VPGEGNVDPRTILVEPSEEDIEHFVLDRKASILMYNLVGFMENKPPDWKEQVGPF
jgi:hypothetical protein